MKKLISGNEATFLGARRAGADFYAGYPITPSNEIMEYAARYATGNQGFRFLQMEDEIASAMAIIGASLAGAKSFTATSGPGFSLMQESVGLAYMMSVPTVFVDVQRVGPSTGMPTYPAQGDILQAAHGSHGDYQALILAPNSVAECYRYAVEAFNLAEDAQSPVVFLTDGFVGHLEEAIDPEQIKVAAPAQRRRDPLGTGHRHFTGLIADKKGIPRTADSKLYQQWYWDKKKTVLSAAEKYRHFEYVPNKKSDTLLISFGISSRLCAELQPDYGYFRPIRLYPILEAELKEVAKNYKKIVAVEANDGQYAGEIERVLKREVGRVALLGGEIKLTSVLEQLKKILAK